MRSTVSDSTKCCRYTDTDRSVLHKHARHVTMAVVVVDSRNGNVFDVAVLWGYSCCSEERVKIKVVMW